MVDKLFPDPNKKIDYVTYSESTSNVGSHSYKVEVIYFDGSYDVLRFADFHKSVKLYKSIVKGFGVE